MTIQASAWAIGQEIPGTAKLVLLALANHAEHKTGRCFGSIEAIAKEACCTPRAALAHLMVLQRNGYVARQVSRNADGGKERCYWLRFDRRSAPWASSHHRDVEGADAAARKRSRARRSRPARRLASARRSKRQRSRMPSRLASYSAFSCSRDRRPGLRGSTIAPAPRESEVCRLAGPS
jgi:Helix-turn-helix domain